MRSPSTVIWKTMQPLTKKKNPLLNARKQKGSSARRTIGFRFNGGKKVMSRWRPACEIWYRGHNSLTTRFYHMSISTIWYREHSFVSTKFSYISTITNMATVQHLQFMSDKCNVFWSAIPQIMLTTSRWIVQLLAPTCVTWIAEDWKAMRAFSTSWQFNAVLQHTDVFNQCGFHAQTKHSCFTQCRRRSP